MLFIALAAAMNIQAGTLSAATDRTHIGDGETLLLTIKYDSSTDEEPDTTELETQFTILSRNTTSSIQIFNGNASRNTTWHYELLPKKTGTLTIPSFGINGDNSDSITIEADSTPSTGVSGGNTPDSNAAEESTPASGKPKIYTETIIDTKPVYVQQQVLVTWRLIHRINISEAQFLPPKIDNVLTQELGNTIYRRTGEDGKTEGVIEQRYALFPQKSGSIAIPAQQFDAAIEQYRRTGLGSIRLGPAQVPFSTDARSIEVLPAPNPDGTTWLPASALGISQEIPDATQTGQVTEGTPFTRIIRTQATGLTAEQLPIPDMQTDGIKVYGEQPVLQNNDTQTGVTGLREDRAAIIATKPGKLVLPAIIIPWYNTGTAQWEKATLPPTELDVLPKMPSNGSTPDTHHASDENRTPAQNNAPSGPAATVAEPAETAGATYNVITAIAIGAALCILCCIGIYVFHHRKKQQTTTGTPPVRPHVRHDTLYAAMQNALAIKDWHNLYHTVLAWKNLHTDNDRITQNADMKQALAALEAYLYGNGVEPDSNTMKSLPSTLKSLAENHTNENVLQLDKLYR